MWGKSWRRNVRLRVSALVLALVTTVGFYGFIQANPQVPTSSPAAVTVSANDPNTAATSSGGLIGSTANSGGSYFGTSNPAPAPVPHTRTRAS